MEMIKSNIINQSFIHYIDKNINLNFKSNYWTIAHKHDRGWIFAASQWVLYLCEISFKFLSLS